MKEELLLRPACPDDLDLLWPLVERAVAHMNGQGNPQWGPDYPTRALYAGDIERGELLAAVDRWGRLLGAACINSKEAPEYAAVDWVWRGEALSVHRLVVDPAVQRRGVATALLDGAEKWAVYQGRGALHLDTYTQNLRMRALLEGRGYCRRGEIHLHGRPLPYPCYEKLLIRREKE